MAETITPRPGHRARHAAVPETRGRRGRRAAQPSGPGGRRRNPAADAALRADACTAAEIIAGLSTFWAPEQVLHHREIAALAAAEARSTLAAPTSRKERDQAEQHTATLEAAVAVLAEAHAAGVLDDVDLSA